MRRRGEGVGVHENSDGKTVAYMDLLVPKVGELIGGKRRDV